MAREFRSAVFVQGATHTGKPLLEDIDERKKPTRTLRRS